MLHVFTALDRFFVLDVGSGALHQLDPMTHDILLLSARGMGDEQIAKQLSTTYHPSDLAEALAELHQLREQGALDAPDSYQGLEMDAPGVVKAMCLHAAHDCNLRCAYCFAATGDFHMQSRSLLSYEVGKAALDWLIKKSGKRHALEVDFFGGEPLMNFPVVKALVAYGRELEQAHNKRFAFTITTNGVGLTDEIIGFVNQEMDNVVLSLDGRREVHDRMRPTANGRGSYDLILPKAQKLAQSRGQQRYYVRGTFSAYNLDFAQDVLALYEAGFEQISVEPVVADPALPYAITPKMVPEVLAEYERLARLYLEKREAGELFNFFHFMVDLSGGPCLKKRLTGCGAGNEYVAVTPEGDIYPCHQFVGREGFKMGNVVEDTFDGDLQHRFQGNHVLNKPVCQGCWAKFFCSGGCAANAHAHGGDIATPNDLECQMQRKRLECALALHAVERLG